MQRGETGIDTGVLCDWKMPVKLKGNVYKTVVRPALLYGADITHGQQGEDKKHTLK